MGKKTKLDKLPEPITIIIDEKEYELDYTSELKCAEETINENLKEQPSLFAWYAVLQEMAEEALSHSKLALEMVEASLDASIRKKALKKKEKLTEKQILSSIQLHDDYIKARTAVIEAKKNAGTLKAIKDAFNHRKEMVLALASNMRAQGDAEIFVNKTKYKKDLNRK